jgi:lipopolysaccharide assembly outer membrane protein LptD (OstA)
MLSPLLVGFLFFVFSGISGMITVKDSEIFEKTEETPLQIGDFEIQEIDTKTNRVKWILNAVNSQSDLTQNQAEVDKPKLNFFDPDLDYQQLKFVITARRASFDKAEQQIILRDNVSLETSDLKYHLHAGHLKFNEQQPYLVVSQNWSLDSTDGYQISGSKGLIAKDFSNIESQGGAELRKTKDGQVNLRAHKIYLEPNTKTPITAEQSAVLHIDDKTDLRAEEIIITDLGAVLANHAVNAKSAKINCFSDHLEIEVDAKKKPLRAVFTKNPYLIQGINTIYADTIIYDFATGKASVIGNVHSD